MTVVGHATHVRRTSTTLALKGLSDQPMVQAKSVVKARWSLEPGPQRLCKSVGAYKSGCEEHMVAKPRGRLH